MNVNKVFTRNTPCEDCPFSGCIDTNPALKGDYCQGKEWEEVPLCEQFNYFGMTYSQIVSIENARLAEQEAARKRRLSILEAKENEQFERKMRRKEGVEKAAVTRSDNMFINKEVQKLRSAIKSREARIASLLSWAKSTAVANACVRGTTAIQPLVEPPTVTQLKALNEKDKVQLNALIAERARRNKERKKVNGGK